MKTYKFEIFTTIIERNIRNGIFKPGHKLPSVRKIKEEYNLSINTVQSGYEYLIINGLVESVAKSGYYVSNKPKSDEMIVKSNSRPIARDAVFKNHLALTTSLNLGNKISEFNATAPGDLIIPQKLLLRTMQQIIREKGVKLLRYYPSNGLEELKNNIVNRSAIYQTNINSNELIITDGALQALYISLSTVCKTGDIVAVESPCVFSVLEMIRVLKLRVIEIPVDLKIGFDVDFFKKACQKNKIKAVIITPNFHNPTGTILTDSQKITLLNTAQQHNVAIIENDIYGDLYFQGSRPSTIKKFDDSGLVFTYSSYSKTLAPGIRLGWLSTGKFLQQAEQIKFALGSTVTPLYQETINRLLVSNAYDRHIRSFRLQLAKNAYAGINLFSTYFPEKTLITNPTGGYNLWVKMPANIDMNHFYKQCEKIGVRFTPGYTFAFTNAFDAYFRVVIADSFSPKRIEAIKLLGEAIQ